MRILVVRIGRVGDTVMTTPALRAIIHCYPDAKITILASPEGKLLLEDFHPNIEQIWTWNRHGPVRSFIDRRKLLNRINSSQFDKIFCFDSSKRIASLFKHTAAEFYWRYHVSESLHCCRHYLDLVATSCDIQAEQFYNYLPVSDTQLKLLDEELSAIGITAEDIIVMMHPTYSGYTRLGLRKRTARIRKLWPAGNYGEVGKRLSKSTIGDRQLVPLMALLPRDLQLGRKIVDYSEGAITLLESHPSFGRYKALIKRANLILTPDSGPMHIASALGTRIVAFFSMKDPADCGPYMDPSLFTILRSDDSIHGISSIDVETVHEAIMGQLERDIPAQGQNPQ